jgi:hypothetical protein
VSRKYSLHVDTKVVASHCFFLSVRVLLFVAMVLLMSVSVSAFVVYSVCVTVWLTASPFWMPESLRD